MTFSTIFWDSDISLCARSRMSTSVHALWYTVEVRGHFQLQLRLHLQPMWSRDSLPHPHHRDCQEHWPVNYWGFSCIHCQSPHSNAGIADALAACLSFTWALGTLTLSPTKPPPSVLSLTFSHHLQNAAGWFSVSMFSGLKHTDLFLKFFNASHSNPGH